jgi:hypothetical protein
VLYVVHDQLVQFLLADWIILSLLNQTQPNADFFKQYRRYLVIAISTGKDRSPPDPVNFQR